MNRVDQLADRQEGFMPTEAIPYKNLIPFDEIIAEARGVAKTSLTVEREYRSLISKFGDEFEILLRAKEEDLSKTLPPRIAEGVLRVRQGRVNIKAGFDGEYGIISIFDSDNKPAKDEEQLSLF